MVSQVNSPARNPPFVGTPPPAKVVDVAAIEAAVRDYHAKQEAKPSATMWHVHNRWGLFAWLEFGLKIGSCITIFIALTSITTVLKISLVRIIEVILFCPLVLGLLIPLVAAFNQREAFNFFYVVVTFLAHIAVIFVVLYGRTGMSLIVFCTLMAVGEIFRLVFLEATPARNLPATFTAGRRRILIGFVFTYIIVYLAVCAMETLTVINDNKEYINPTFGY